MNNNGRGKTLYLSGPITDNPTHRTLFKKAKDLVIWYSNWEIFNPAEIKLLPGEEDTPANYMRHAVEELLNADAILMLTGWKDSVGAKIELELAHYLGLPAWEYKNNLNLDDWPKVLPLSVEKSWNSYIAASQALEELTCLESCLHCGNYMDECGGCKQKQEEPETIDAEARRVVYGDRGKVYGSATGDFERTGKMWGAILGIDAVNPARVALCMMALKMSRLHNTPDHRDSMVDIIGYSLCMKDIVDEKGQ